MNYLLLLISLALGIGKNLVAKGGGPKFSGMTTLLRNNIVTAVLALAVFGCTGIDLSFLANPRVLGLSALLGVFIMLSQMFYIRALKKEKVALCSLIYSCGFLIPTILGALVYHETVMPWNILGLILVLLSIFLVSGAKGLTFSPSLGWAALAMLSSGLVGFIQKVYAHTYQGHSEECLFVAFLVMLLLSVGMTVFCKKEKEASAAEKRTLLLIGLFALCVVFTNRLNLYLSGALPSFLFFPVYNGGCIALTAVCGMLFFREELSKRQRFGVLLNLASIILVSLS